MLTQFDSTMSTPVKKVLFAAAICLLPACSGPAGQPDTTESADQTSTSATNRPSGKPQVASTTPVNAMPLGFELGYANIDGLKSKLADAAELSDAGSNEYSKGPMLRSDGSNLGIEGLKSALFIFGPDETLQGVILTLPRGPQHRGATGELAQTLSKKYKLVSKNFEPFLDHGNFRFEQGDSWIDIDSPHLSFEMTVTYATKKLLASYELSRMESEQTARQKSESLL